MESILVGKCLFPFVEANVVCNSELMLADDETAESVDVVVDEVANVVDVGMTVTVRIDAAEVAIDLAVVSTGSTGLGEAIGLVGKFAIPSMLNLSNIRGFLPLTLPFERTKM